MKRSVRLLQLLGFGVISLAGTLLHFLYDWLGKAKWIAGFSGVNESTWEHMKLLFWPMFIYAVIESVFLYEAKDFWCIKLRGIMLGLTLIPILFYTYNGVIGRSPDWINIAIFFVSAAVALIYETQLLSKGDIVCKSPKSAFIVLCIIGILFIVFTFAPPKLDIFKDPLMSTYGI